MKTIIATLLATTLIASPGGGQRWLPFFVISNRLSNPTTFT